MLSSPGGPKASGVGGGGQPVPEGGGLLRREASLPADDHPYRSLFGCSSAGMAAVGEHEQAGAAVRGVRDPGEVAVVHQVLHQRLGMSRLAQVADSDFLLDLWSRESASVAHLEGLR